jgi:methanogenic corrinoid protein MtbC1
MDPRELDRILTRSAMAFSLTTVVDEVIVPLLSRIGTAWETGRVGPAHEHVATVEVRRFLEWLLTTVEVAEGAPVLVAGTPTGERHELGGLLAALSAAASGWKGVFLGPDLPAEEVVSAALRLEAEVVALSCVDPRTAKKLPSEIMKIRGRLPADVHLIIGGPLTRSPAMEEMGEGVEVLPSFAELRKRLGELGT